MTTQDKVQLKRLKKSLVRFNNKVVYTNKLK